MPLRTALLIGAACITIGWLIASLVSPPVAELQGRNDGRHARATREPAPTATYTEQLNLKLRQAPLPPTPRRNPFVFGVRPRAAVAEETPVREATGETTVAVEGELPPIVVGPSLTLSGIAATHLGTGTVRTAVISDGRTVQLVKEGDVVNGYAVVEIGESSVTLANAAGARWTLRLP